MKESELKRIEQIACNEEYLPAKGLKKRGTVNHRRDKNIKPIEINSVGIATYLTTDLPYHASFDVILANKQKEEGGLILFPHLLAEQDYGTQP